jgi:predicted dehydrogenase
VSADVRLAVVGLGYWGPNLLRAAWDVESVDVTMACDRDMNALARQARRYQSIRLTTSFDDVLAAPDVDAVVIATPIHTHHALAREALIAGKHVMVEKPMADSVDQCHDLIEIALRC